MTETTLLDVEGALALLERAVQEKGEDYVYPLSDKRDGICRYAVDYEPSCIVGHVLFYLGKLDAAIEGASAHTVLHDLATDEAKYLLLVVQRAQDAGKPWGQALGEAKARQGVGI
jgi:hypothetical protein